MSARPTELAKLVAGDCRVCARDRLGLDLAMECGNVPAPVRP